MSYATIMTHVQPSADFEPRVRLAAQVANLFEATLMGVGAEMIYPITVGAFGEAVVIAGEEAVRDDLAKAEAVFRQASKSVRLGVDWRAEVAFPESSIAAHARAADLIVASPKQPDGPGFFGSADPGELLMQTGRPVLVAPTYTTAIEPGVVMVGWKDTRESRRAVVDALPFLDKAGEVILVETCETDEGEVSAEARLADVAAWLLRHGVKATTKVRPHPPHGAARDLAQAAVVHEADLIVIGGYGHSRLREWIFGGVTQSFLAHPPKPVLLSR